MADHDRMIAISVAVADSVPQKYLGGALTGARAFDHWATKQGYETALIMDDSDPVTVKVLREGIEKILLSSAQPINRIVVYFAGHGLIREMEEGLWLLSDWRKELRAVAVEVFKRRLSMYGPRQICIISDACRSLPKDVAQADLISDGVLGAGPKPFDQTVAIDKFIAAQDGAEAFMIPNPNHPDQDRCLFSGVLIEGLWGRAGLQAEPFSKLQPDKVTSRSLGAYLLVESSARAKDYGLTLTPSISPTFPEGEDFYFTRNPAVVAPTFAPWPPKGTLIGTGQGPPQGQEPLRGLGLQRGGRQVEVSGDFESDGGHRMDLSSTDWADVDLYGAPSTIGLLREQSLPDPGAGVWSGVAVLDEGARQLWLTKGNIAERIGTSNSWFIKSPRHSTIDSPAPVLVEFSDGRFAAPVVLKDLFTCLVRDEYGVTGIIYRDVQAPSNVPLAAEKALAALENGTLRPDAATDLAAMLREGKHVDPVLGVISAYLYDAIGDIASIQRMAASYVQSGEAIPYDIALLGGLHGWRGPNDTFEVHIPEVKGRAPRTEAEHVRHWTHCSMPESDGTVAGFWPWMRQGWVFLDEPSDVGSPLIVPGLVELRSGLMRSRFTTFEKVAGLELARLFGLNPVLTE